MAVKIIVAIPSLNEEENIQNIARIVDRGLSKYYPEIPSLILNVDSGSNDKTVKTFLNTPTTSPKKAVVNGKGMVGKGRNIKEALSFVGKEDIFVMLDADLTSARPVWLYKLVGPVISDKVDMVAPLYTRNKYEGNTTNHFSSPVLYACYNKDIVQPIAGDFCFTGKLAKEVFKSIQKQSDYQYGIDTVITWTAMIRGYRIAQVKLGKKIHKPSFPKIVPMSGQVISTTFRLVSRNQKEIIIRLREKAHKLNKQKVFDEIYIKKPSSEKIAAIELLALNRLKDVPSLPFLTRQPITQKALNGGAWTLLLVEYLYYLLSNEINDKEIEILSSSLVTFYLLRVLGYFKEVKDLSSIEAEEILYNQKRDLRIKLLKRFSR